MAVLVSWIGILLTLLPLLFDLAYYSNRSVSKITSFCRGSTKIEDKEPQRKYFHTAQDSPIDPRKITCWTILLHKSSSRKWNRCIVFVGNLHNAAQKGCWMGKKYVLRSNLRVHSIMPIRSTWFNVDVIQTIPFIRIIHHSMKAGYLAIRHHAYVAVNLVVDHLRLL